MTNITPIFTLGAPRSGTTWLGNMLLQNYGIPTPSHPLHYGILESNIYLIHSYFGDFKNQVDYIQFLEQFAVSDYFLLAKGEKALFYTQKPANFYHFYFDLMDQYCKKEGKNSWTTKLDPFFFVYPDALKEFLKVLEERYTTLKFIGIQRKYEAYLKSYLHVSGPAFNKRRSRIGNMTAPFLGAARYKVYNDHIAKLIKQYDGLMLHFDDLKDEASRAKIGTYLQMEWKEYTAPQVKSNTSFAKKEKEKASTKVPFMGLARTIFLNAPGLSQFSLRQYEQMKSSRNPLTWRLLRAKYDKEGLIKEMEGNNDIYIVELLKQNTFQNPFENQINEG